MKLPKPTMPVTDRKWLHSRRGSMVQDRCHNSAFTQAAPHSQASLFTRRCKEAWALPEAALFMPVTGVNNWLRCSTLSASRQITWASFLHPQKESRINPIMIHYVRQFPMTVELGCGLTSDTESATLTFQIANFILKCVLLYSLTGHETQ